MSCISKQTKNYNDGKLIILSTKEMQAMRNEKPVFSIPAGFFDIFKLDHLTRLEALLTETCEGGTRSIDVNAFRTAVKIVLNDNISSQEIESIYHKIDVFSSDAVSWQEIVSYFLQLCNERDLQKRYCTFLPFVKISGKFPSLDHHDSTMAMQISPDCDGSMDMASGNYTSISRNGYLISRNADLEIISKHLIEDYPQKDHPTIAVTDMVCLGDVDMVAASTSCWDIRFYNSSPSDFQIELSIVEFPRCIMALDYYVQPFKMVSDSLLICGDDEGGVHLIWTNPHFFLNLQMSIALKQKLSKIQYVHICKKLIAGIKLTHLKEVHSEAILKIKYFHCIQSFISCSSSTREAFVIYDFSKQDKTIFKSPRGVRSFDFCESKDWVITGCMDNSIRIWNRFIIQKPTKILYGHISPVEFIIVDESRMLMMSFCRLNYLKVWNFVNGICLQTINCNNVGFGLHAVTCVTYNSFHRTLLVHTHHMVMFKAGGADDVSKQFIHQQPIIAVLFSNKFESVVTGDSGSLVAVWDLKTGQQMFRFLSFHRTTDYGFGNPIEMTAMALDSSQRRLITADSDMTIKIWNHNAGIKLNTLKIKDPMPVNFIANIKNYFYISGSKMHVFYDDGNISYQSTWKDKPNMKIVCISVYRDSIVATIDISGEIIIWLKELGRAMRRLSDIGSNYNGYSTLYLKKIATARENARKILQRKKNIKYDSENYEMGQSNDLDLVSEESDTEKTVKTEAGPEPPDISQVSYEAKADFEIKNNNAKDTGNISKNDEHDIEYEGGIDDEDERKIALQFPFPKIVEQVIEGKEHAYSASSLLFLENRKNDCEVGTLVSAGIDGKVRIWSAKPGSGLLARFRARMKALTGIASMATDSENRYLATGDSNGYLRLWLIKGYCNNDDVVSEDEIVEYFEKFPYLRMQKVFEDKGLKEKQYNPQPRHPLLVMTYAPLLLNSYRAHLDAITQLEFANTRKLILTGSWDKSVRVWCYDGSFIGSFGQNDLWNLEIETIMTSSRLRNMPSDIRAVASPTTLRILNNGKCPRWKRALRAVRRCKRICGSSAPWEDETANSKQKSERYRELNDKSPILGKCQAITGEGLSRSKIPPLDDVNFKVAAYKQLEAPDIEPRSAVKITEEVAKSLIRIGYINKAKKNKLKGSDPETSISKKI